MVSVNIGAGPAGHVGGAANSICGSCCGAIFGILLALSSVVLLHWNEGSAVQTYRSLNEGLALVKSVQPAMVKDWSQYEGQLIHLTADLTTPALVASTSTAVSKNLPPPALITDTELGVSAHALALFRQVRMLQWVEHSREHKEEQFDYQGNRQVVTRTEYYHSQEWSTTLATSSHSAPPSPNPVQFPFESLNLHVDQVIVANPHAKHDHMHLTVPTSLVQQLPNEKFNVPAQSNAASSKALARQGLHAVRGQLQSYSNRSPFIGDVQITYEIIRPQKASIVAQVSQGELIPYATNAGDALEMISPGTISATVMFENAHTANTIKTWALRALGGFLMFIGIRLMVDPLAAIFTIIPFVGSMLAGVAGCGLTLVAMVLAFSASLAVIALSWLWFRPLLSVTLVVAALIPFVVSRYLKPNQPEKKKSDQPLEPGVRRD